MSFSITDQYVTRHIGPREADVAEMLKAIGADSLDQLIEQTVPASIRLGRELDLPEALSEFEFLSETRRIASKNFVYKSYIGLGYYDTITPAVIQRNVFENPGWYTQYTPYQAEIAQGRLEALLNFQQMVVDLTGMEIANASLLDEATAAAEGMALLHRSRPGDVQKREANAFFISRNIFPQTVEVLRTRAEPLGIEIVVGDVQDFRPEDRFFGILLQYPGGDGAVEDYSSVVAEAAAHKIRSVVATDLLALTLLKPPGEWGADVVVGNSQRFGVPLGYGGPHAAFFATRDEFKRSMPGRLVGVSVDRNGRTALRLALQTREQHIRREKATSNICTAQALLAIMASMYAVYHGPEGLKAIASRVHAMAEALDTALQDAGFEQLNASYFDTLKLRVSAEAAEKIHAEADQAEINFRRIDAEHIGVSFDETTTLADLETILQVFYRALGKTWGREENDLEAIGRDLRGKIPASLERQSGFLDHPVFHAHHSETRMMRYIRLLEGRDLSLNAAMIPLGSCTMKLNAAAAMQPVSWAEFGRIHPFAPLDQTHGYQQIFSELGAYLAEITGLAAVSLQPNSGAQGEYAGLMVIRAYHRQRGDFQRDIALIPVSAHGTNPASAAMAGFQVALVNCDEMGNVDMADLRSKAEKYSDRLGALMVTYPSTHGVFEETIQEICELIHSHGGQVYMDGANMNAQVGLTSPGKIGADVCHLNLHKTFSIPHGGGGPGMGPICVAEHLEPFLPGHALADRVGGEHAIPAIASAPWGSPSILLISYAYIKMLGKQGVLDATKYAILNANYLKARLEKDYVVLYMGKNGRIAHEMIIDTRVFKKDSGIEVEDIAKRLIDYGFHAPTMSWPVAGTMMIEPTESEPKEELDRFCDAMIQIRREIQEIADGKADATDNVLKNSPHTAEEIASDDWKHSYGREKAAYPLRNLRTNKFWSSVGRIDNVYGDRNLMCECPPMEAYAEEPELAGSAGA